MPNANVSSKLGISEWTILAHRKDIRVIVGYEATPVFSKGFFTALFTVKWLPSVNVRIDLSGLWSQLVESASQGMDSYPA